MQQLHVNILKVKKVMKEWDLEFNKCSQVVLKEVESSIDSLYTSNLSGIFLDEESSSLKSLLPFIRIFWPKRKPPGG
jgi:hypothetical protein